MKRLLFLLFLFFLLLTGCANPTESRIYHPLDKPKKSKAEVVKYEGVIPKTQSRELAYESRTETDTTLFMIDRFCYDPQNDYIVLPSAQGYSTDRWFYDDSLNKGLFTIIPKDSITICKKGFKNNSYLSRNHPLHGIVWGALTGGIVLGFSGLAGGWIAALMAQDGAVWGQMIAFGAAIGAGIGASIGLLVDGAPNMDNPVDDEAYRCDEYLSESELVALLNDNKCY